MPLQRQRSTRSHRSPSTRINWPVAVINWWSADWTTTFFLHFISNAIITWPGWYRERTSKTRWTVEICSPLFHHHPHHHHHVTCTWSSSSTVQSIGFQYQCQCRAGWRWMMANEYLYCPFVSFTRSSVAWIANVSVDGWKREMDIRPEDAPVNWGATDGNLIGSREVATLSLIYWLERQREKEEEEKGRVPWKVSFTAPEITPIYWSFLLQFNVVNI